MKMSLPLKPTHSGIVHNYTLFLRQAILPKLVLFHSLRPVYTLTECPATRSIVPLASLNVLFDAVVVCYNPILLPAGCDSAEVGRHEGVEQEY